MTISVTSSGSNNKKIKINKELLMRLAPLLSLIILVIFFSFGSPFFFNTENIMTIALQTSVIGIMAIGVPSSLSRQESTFLLARWWPFRVLR